MMHYSKGENVEKEITKTDLPFEDCMPQGQKDFLWMHVKGGTKVTNVISFAKNALDKGEYRTVVWSGSGGGVVKTISCAEILKRDYALYQVTRMCYTTVEEHWKPQMDGLEEIVANRQIPCLHILMTLDVIDDAVSGLQKPNSKTDFWVYNSEPPAQQQRRDNRHNQQQQRPGNGRHTQRPRNSAPKPEKQQQTPQDLQQQATPNQKKAKNVNRPSPNQQHSNQTSQRKRGGGKVITDPRNVEPMDT